MANASDIWSCESCSFSTVASEYEGAFLRSRCWYTAQRSTVLWLCRFYQQGTNGLLFILGLLFLDILPWKLFRESCKLFASEASGPFGCGNDSNGFQLASPDFSSRGWIASIILEAVPNSSEGSEAVSDGVCVSWKPLDRRVRSGFWGWCGPRKLDDSIVACQSCPFRRVLTSTPDSEEFKSQKLPTTWK